MGMKRVVNGDEMSLYDANDKKVLTLRGTIEDTCVFYQMEGSLKSDVAHDMLDELKALAGLGMDIMVDLEKITYMSAACANAFLTVQKAMDKYEKGSLTLCKVPQDILSEMEKSGLASLLMIEE